MRSIFFAAFFLPGLVTAAGGCLTGDPSCREERKKDQAELSAALSRINGACDQAGQAPAAKPAKACFRPEDNIRLEGTFAHALLDPAAARNLYAELGPPCGKLVSGIYKDGRTLASKAVMNAAKPLRSLQFPSGLHTGSFYHYTKSPKMLELLHPEVRDRSKANADAVKNGEYGRIFGSYKLGESDPLGKGFWNRVHYLSEDPVTSQYAGPLRVRFVLDPEARVLTWDDGLWAAALAELDRRFPGFKLACGSNLDKRRNDTYGATRYSDALFIIAEDSGIDLLDYNAKRWFMMVSPRSIRETHLERCDIVKVPRGFEPEKQPGLYVPACRPYSR